MKTLNLFLKMHFTSLSPDGQCISLAIVSEEIKPTDIHGIILRDPTDTDKDFERRLRTGRVVSQLHGQESKSFYSEFQDFDINQCDDWVKENVISKLKFDCPVLNGITSGELSNWKITNSNTEICADTKMIKEYLIKFLSQFSDYKLNFIVDCGWFTWGKFVELMGEWEYKKIIFEDSEGIDTEKIVFKGLPKLPANFPPVPQDLNELIAFKKRISVSEAFELDREDFIREMINDDSVFKGIGPYNYDGTLLHMVDLCRIGSSNKYNALWDVKVTKAIWEKMV